jgi:uncharacterized protein (TIGR03435 family)
MKGDLSQGIEQLVQEALRSWLEMVCAVLQSLQAAPAGQTLYDIDATMPPGTTKEQFQEMLQNLLVERFHLEFHRERRNFPA